MDNLLGKLTSQAMNYAIRSGIAITTTYAINQCTRLLKQTPANDNHRQELLETQLRLESKIRIVSPAIDMIELISARGNTTLESAVSLTKSIRFDIQHLGSKIASVVERRESKGNEDVHLLAIILSMKALLVKIDDAIPLINLAITTSGVNLTTKLSGTISPSRLLQASTFLVAADTNYGASTHSGTLTRQQVGPTWTLTLYMLFAGHANRAVDEAGIRQTTWKEVMNKARVKLVRVPLDRLYSLPGDRHQEFSKADMIEGEECGSEFAYQLLIIEDLDDSRVHTFEDHVTPPRSFDGVSNAGVRDVIPIHEISKIFYADTGKILNIGSSGDDVNNPVLLIKRDVHAEPPRRMLHRSQMSSHGIHAGWEDSEVDEDQSEIDTQILRESTPEVSHDETSKWRLPEGLDLEWMAFEVHVEQPESESEEEEPGHPSHELSDQIQASSNQNLMAPMSKLRLRPQRAPSSTHADPNPIVQHYRTLPPMTTTLSLLEMLLKLTSLQQFRQESHLSISDELLNFFLEDSATAGDKHSRRKTRNDAVQRLGFDPYDESPVKRRGEEYIAGARGKVDELEMEPPEWLRASAAVDEAPCEACGSPISLSSPLTREQDRRATARDTPEPLPSQPTEIMRHSAPQALSKAKSQVSLLATPSYTSQSRLAFVRAHSEPSSKSPLSMTVESSDEGGERVDIDH